MEHEAPHKNKTSTSPSPTPHITVLADHLGAQSTRAAKNLTSLLTLLQHERILTLPELNKLLGQVDASRLTKAQEKLTSYAKKFDYTRSSINTYRSRLKQLVQVYQTACLTQPPARTAPLGQRLLWYARKEIPTATQQRLLESLCDTSGIAVPTLKRWIHSTSTPRAQHYDGLTKLARRFDLAEDYFTQTAPSYFAMRAVEQARSQQATSPREKLPPAPAMTDTIKQQLSALLAFKNKARTPSINTASFPLKRREAPALKGGGRWTSTPDGRVESAANFARALERYFRWVLATHPLSAEQLDLSLLATIELLEEYVDTSLEFELYGTLLAFLAPLAGLLDPDTGYLSRYHAPMTPVQLNGGHKTEAFTTLTEWQEQARYLSHQIKAWVKDTRHLHRELNHDTEDSGRRNINWLLDRPDATLDDSVKDVRLMAHDLLTGDPSRSLTTQLAAKQVGVWLLLSLEVPLRVSNWCSLELVDSPPSRTHSSPVIWFDEQQSNYHLRVPRGWLKNRRGRETEQIDTVFANTRIKDAVEGLRELRTRIGIQSPYLFIQTRNSVTKAIGDRYHRTALAKSIQTWTGRIAFARWPDRGITNGINPHALRHFVASYVLEKTGDYRLAATSLMDSVSVVISVYGKNDHSTNQRKLVALQSDE